MRKNLRIGIMVVLVLLLLCGCTEEQGGDEAVSVSVQPTAAPTPTPEPTPVPLDQPLTLQLNPELADGDTETWGAGDIRLKTDERKIGSLYLIWNTVPGEWTLIADGQAITCGGRGFLHEYIELDKPASEVIIRTAVPLCDVYAFERDSRLPSWVQIWQEPWDDADLLAFPTHADDEHLFFGGMLPYYSAERGLKVQVVYLTNHWNQDPRRPHELLAGLWEVGIRAYPIMGPLDDLYASSLERAEELFKREDVLAFQVEMLRRFRPGVVIGHDLEGEYGHGVHILNAVCLTEAVELAADASQYAASAEQYGTWNTPKLYLHLYERNPIVMDWYAPMEAFGGATGIDVAKAGYAHHVSQHAYAFYVYGAEDEYDSRLFGLYRSTVGPDVNGGDVFENITNYY